MIEEASDGEAKTILFGLCGHGHFDLAAYDAYLAGKLEDPEFSEADLEAALAALPGGAGDRLNDGQGAGSSSAAHARPVGADLLLALGAGIELQVELFFADGSAGRAADRPRRALLAGRRDRACAGGRRSSRSRWPASRSSTFEQFAISDDGLVGPFFALLFVAYSLGAQHRRAAARARRRARAGRRLLTIAARPAAAPDDVLFLATIMVGGPVLLGRLVRDRVAARPRAAREGRRDRAGARRAAARRRCRRSARGSPASCTRWSRPRSRRWSTQSETAERLARSDPDAAEAALESIESTRPRGARRDPRCCSACCGARTTSAALEPLPSLTPPGRPRRARARGRAAGRADRRGRARRRCRPGST